LREAKDYPPDFTIADTINRKPIRSNHGRKHYVPSVRLLPDFKQSHRVKTRYKRNFPHPGDLVTLVRTRGHHTKCRLKAAAGGPDGIRFALHQRQTGGGHQQKRREWKAHRN
jgi:hypothetical protein